MTKQICYFVVLSLAFLSARAAAETYTYPQLVDRLTNLQGLATLPAPGEKICLASSYDRRSQYDAAKDKYIGWSMNEDGSGIVRKEGENDVLMDAQGPGCIWRIWTATANKGHVKIYLDGATIPAVDLPFADYFDGKTAPFNRPNLVYISSADAHGFNNYTPITFQKSCKIVAEKDWGAYFQFTYTQFPTGTVIPTFNMKFSAADSAALDEADKILGACGHNPAGDSANDKATLPVTVDAGKTATVVDLDGAGAITALKVKLDLPKDPDAARVLLRQLTISITWDGETTPAVWSPLGDFFGYVGGADTFQSLPVGLMEDGTFYSYWYMPYGKKAHIELGNDGPSSVATSWEISHAPLTHPIEKLARFHAKWHRDALLPTRRDREHDWTLLMTQGAGRYVGTHLHIWNPRGRWWGEGDDKFFIDGEKFPSIFGTGSEDYFGYAWSAVGHFSRPYHNQILNENNEGHIDDNRWHISDSVPFDTSFEGDIEKYFENERSTLYAAEVFWYLSAGGNDPYPPVAVSDRIGYWVKLDIYHEPNVIEGELLWPVPRPAGAVHILDMYSHGKGWSGDQQFWWGADKTGESCELALPAQKAGSYRLTVHATVGPRYGIFQMSLNGKDLGQATDFYDPEIKTKDPIDLGVVTLPDGKPIFKMTVTGTNPAAQGSEFGLDYLKLTPVP